MSAEDNLGVEINHEAVRVKINEQLCQYLIDEVSYNQYYQKACKRLGLGKEMKVIERSLLKHWLNRIKRIQSTSDNELKFLMKQDQRRNVLLRSLG